MKAVFINPSSHPGLGSSPAGGRGDMYRSMRGLGGSAAVIRMGGRRSCRMFEQREWMFERGSFGRWKSFRVGDLSEREIGMGLEVLSSVEHAA